MKVWSAGKFATRGIVLLLCVFALPGLTFAANHFIRSGASGNGSGSDWTNAMKDFPGNCTRGDTYYVAAGSYGSCGFPSGTATITIKAATAADHGTDTGWSASFVGQAQIGSFYFNTGNVVIDGQYRSSYTSGYGFKISLAQATAGCTARCAAFLFDGGNLIPNVTVRYVEVAGSGVNAPVKAEFAIYAWQGVPAYADPGFVNFTFQFNYFHDFPEAGTPLQVNGIDPFLFEGNEVARNVSTAAHHGEAWADCGSSNVTIKNNWFVDIQGTGVIVSLNAGFTCSPTNWQIYGNVFWEQNPSTYSADNGAIACINNNACKNWQIYNNTFANFTTGNGGFSGRIDFGESNGGTFTAYDNLWFNSVGVGPTCSGSCTLDYNAYFSCQNVSTEPHSQVANSNPFVSSSSGNFHLAVQTQAGLALAAPFNVDQDGVTRGGGGWSRGAFQFLGSAPNPPSNLQVVVVK